MSSTGGAGQTSGPALASRGKGSGGLAKIKLRGKAKVDAVFTLALAAYNLIRMPKLLAAA